MKKLLALVLALVMTLSLCITSNAAFTDAEDINYDEAVDVMAGLQILEGYDTGDFKPATVLNREQAAKIITYMQLGKKTADALSVKSSFTDTQGNWAESYIAYAASQGIIAGVGDNKFDPKGELTGYAFAKMVLCALGYDAKYEGFVGSDWMVKVAKLVNTLELNDGMEDVVLSAGMTREQAAQMAFNGLFKATQNFKKGTTVAGTGLTISVGGEYGAPTAPLFETVFGGNVFYGVVTNNASNDKDQLKRGTTIVTSIANDYNNGYDGVTSLAPVTKEFSLVTDASLYGKYVKVCYKDAYTSSAKPGTAYAIVDKTVETAVDKDDKAAAVKSALSADDYSVASNVVFGTKYQNGATTSTTITVIPGTTSGATSGTVTLYGYYNDVTKTTTPYGYAVADDYTVEKITAIGTVAGKETISISGTAKNNNATEDIVNEYEDIAKDDVVFCYNNGDIYNLVKPTVVTGKVTAVSTKSGSESLTVDGTTYKLSGATNNSGVSDVAIGNVGFTDEYKLYLDAAGNVGMITGVSVDKDLVYVVATYEKTATGDYGAGAPKYFVQGVDATGKEVNYQVYYGDHYADANGDGTSESATKTGTGYLLSGAKVTKYGTTDKVYSSAEVVANTLYEVTTAYDSTAKADMATLTAIAVNGATKGAYRTNNAALKTSTPAVNGTYFFNDDVQFIFVKDSKADLKVTTATGKQAVAADAAIYWTAYGTKASTATNYNIKYVFVTGDATVETSSIAFANESKNSTSTVPYTDAAGNTQTAFQHTVYVDGKETTILMSGATAIAGFKKLTTDAVTGLTTAADFTNTDTQKSVVGARATQVYNGYMTTAVGTPGTYVKAAGDAATALTNALVADAKVVDLTDNGITSVAELGTLVATDANAVVEVAFVYDDTKSNDDVAIIYITDATFTTTVANGTSGDAGKMVATYNISDDNIAADGVSYQWSDCATSTGTYVKIPDASASKTLATTDKYYKCEITITSADGYTFKATNAAGVQAD